MANARVGQQGTLTRIWARRGTRPRAPRDTRYQWAFARSLEPVAVAGSLIGAVCPARGTAAGLVLPFVNTAAMNAHLAEIARTVAPGAHALLILDGTGWHGSNALAVPDNLSLLTLPPLSLRNLSGWWWQTRPRPALGRQVRAVAWGSSADRPQT